MNDWLASAVALIGVASSGVLAYLAYWLNRQAQRNQAHKEIADLYDKVLVFRAEHPALLRLSRLWTADRFRAMYVQESSDDRSWAAYTAYVELCISFCNAALHGWKDHHLDRGAYEGRFKPLVKLLLTENYPLISGMLASGKYISSYIKEFVRELEENEHWDWAKMHQDLVG